MALGLQEEVCSRHHSGLTQKLVGLNPPVIVVGDGEWLTLTEEKLENDLIFSLLFSLKNDTDL